jgi:hypothetical protein
MSLCSERFTLHKVAYKRTSNELLYTVTSKLECNDFITGYCADLISITRRHEIVARDYQHIGSLYKLLKLFNVPSDQCTLCILTFLPEQAEHQKHPTVVFLSSYFAECYNIINRKLDQEHC